jgi:hypothetical protein
MKRKWLSVLICMSFLVVLLGIVWKGIARRGEDKASYLSKKGDSQCKTENYTDSY